MNTETDMDSSRSDYKTSPVENAWHRRKDFLLYDVGLPLGGYVSFWLLNLQSGREQAEIWRTFMLPLILCIVRAGIGSRVLKQPHVVNLSLWRRIVHQVLFAAALLVLMACETLSAPSRSHDDSLILRAFALGFYLLYLLLRCTADFLIRKQRIHPGQWHTWAEPS